MTPSMEERQFWGGDIPWITPKDMKQDAIRDSEIKVTEAALRNTSLRLVRPSAVLMVVRGMILARKVPIAWTTGPVTINQDMKALLPAQGLKAEFLARVLVAAQRALLSMIDVAGHGTRRLPTERWHALAVPIPIEDEQSAIARFLDHADRRIRRYIRTKEKLIALLEEQKRTLVHQAVTGQVDVRTGQPYPAHKPSGVEWLGNVPEHWDVVALKRISLGRCDGPFGSGLKSSHYSDQGIRVIRLQNIGHGEFNYADAAYISASHYARLGDHSVEAGDVLIAGLGDANHPAGRACVAPACVTPAMVKADCFRFRLNTNLVDPEFVSLQLTATAGTASEILSTGATRKRTNLQITSARMIAIPSPREQCAIVEYARVRTSREKDAQQAVEREIALLAEHRIRLIADVVTGKLDVREAAATLPEGRPPRERWR